MFPYPISLKILVIVLAKIMMDTSYSEFFFFNWRCEWK